MNNIVIIIIGPPGCGKGTQVDFIIKDYNCEALEMGDRLRKIASSNSKNDKVISHYLKTGKLLPNKYVMGIVEDFVRENKGKLMLFDGFPRYLSQAKEMEKVFEKYNVEKYYVINIDIGESEIVKRLMLRKRKDDNEITIKNRIKVFHKLTVPMLEYFHKKDKIKKINGEDTRENVMRRLKSVLKDIIK